MDFASPRPNLAPDAINDLWGYSGEGHPTFTEARLTVSNVPPGQS
jgi:hypothetical protein